MIFMLYLPFLFHLLAFAEAVSHSSSSTSSVNTTSASLNRPELFLRKKRNLTWGKIQDLPIIDKDEVAQIRNKEYSKRYRKAHPSRVKQIVRLYKQRLKKDPIRSEKTRLRVQKYNREYHQRRKIHHSSKRSTIKEKLSKDVNIRSKRKEINIEGESRNKRPRILHYGRPPMSNAFIPPEPKNAIDRESAINPTEANSQRPRHIVRIKLARTSSSATPGPPREGADQQSTT